MNEVEFTFNREVEEPLYLDSTAYDAPKRRGAERPGPEAADRPLQLDARPREPKRRGGAAPLIIGCVITFVVGAGIGALVLEPPVGLRERLAALTGGTVGAAATPPPAARAAEVAAPTAQPPTEPAPESAAVAAAQAKAAAEAPIPAAPPVAEAPPTVQPAAAPAPRTHSAAQKPHHAAAAPKKHTVEAKPKPKPAHASHAAAKSGLDLDALEKSLN
jgi:hypothetical protein